MASVFFSLAGFSSTVVFTVRVGSSCLACSFFFFAIVS
ncbi:hypothetical protein EVA_12440 [gut metagenome]|uniref:Uncharacterized protein n=1 Tax=gut metagenome TaxID=749906 RepID=J9GCD7_9ZZZZ